MKKILMTGLLILLGSVLVSFGHAPSAHAYTNSRMIDDAVFDKVNSMSEQQIRDFINSHPNTCLTRVGSGFGGGNVFPNPVNYFTYDSNNLVDAAHVVYASAQAWGINPQVLLATMQKEQVLLTDNDCIDNQGFPTLHKAMGQGCAEGGPCPSSGYDGFSQQLMKGAWQLKFNKERANGNTSWDGDDNVVYGGFMTQGNRKRCGSCASNFYNGFATIDGQSVYLENGSTAGLYSFTPHLNQSFPPIFERYFGSTYIPNYSSSVVSITYGRGSSSIPITEEDTVTVVAKNTGSATWTNSGFSPVRLGTWTEGRQSSFYDSSWQGPLTPALLQESSVAPGANGTFVFNVQAGQIGSFNEQFNLVAENITWFNNPSITVPFTVTSGNFSNQLVSQSSSGAASGSGSTLTLNHDTTATLTVTMKNTGNVTWRNNGKAPVKIGTWPLGRGSPFTNGSWIGPYTPAAMQQASVAPGSNATFVFTVTAPPPGTYHEGFIIYADNYAFMNDVNLAFDITVPPDYVDQAVSQSSTVGGVTSSTSSLTMAEGQTASLTFTVKNVGTKTWTNSGPNPVRIASWPYLRQSQFRDGSWIGPYTPATLQQASVAPGSNGTFTFTARAPATAGTYHEGFLIYTEGLAFMNDVNLAFDITVPPDYQADTVSQSWSTGGSSHSGNTVTIAHGAAGQLTIVLKNTGSATWTNSGNDPVRLATWPFWRSSPFADNTWAGPYTPTALQESSVAPGANGTFIFHITAPSSTGSYLEVFDPVAENITFFPDDGLNFSVTVN